MSQTLKGCLLALMTGSLWALSSPIAKYLSLRGTDVSTVTLGRLGLTSLILALWFFWHDRAMFKIQPRLWWMLFAFGPLMSLGLYYGFALSAVYLPVAMALIIHYTFPMAVTIASAVFLREMPTRSDFYSGLLILAGVSLSAFTPQWTIDTSMSIPGVLWGLLAVAGMVGQTLFSRLVVRAGAVNPLTQLFYVHLTGFFWLAVYRLFAGGTPLFAMVPVEWFYTAILAVFSSLVAYGSYGFAMSFIRASTASMLASSEIVVAVLIALFFLGEWPTLPQVLGSVIIITAICVAAIGQRKREEHSVVPADVDC